MRLLILMIDRHLQHQWDTLEPEARAQINDLLSQVYMLTLTNTERAALHAVLGTVAKRDN